MLENIQSESLLICRDIMPLLLIVPDFFFYVDLLGPFLIYLIESVNVTSCMSDEPNSSFKKARSYMKSDSEVRKKKLCVDNANVK